MITYVRKPKEVVAVVWTGLNLSELKKFAEKYGNVKIDPSFKEGVNVPDDAVVVNTPAGWRNVAKNEVIVMDDGNLYVWNRKKFDEEYEDPNWVARMSIGA